jgi:6-phosphogluconolactonase (cycloisomerase 2 family)
MVANPAGTLLFALDQAGEAVEVYQIDTAGALTGPTTTPLPSGFKPFNLAVDGQGKFVYVSNISGLATTQVAVYSITGTTISAVSGSPFSSILEQMQGEASGKFMVGTSGGIFFNNGDQNLYVGSIGQSGALTVTPIPTAGVPSSVAVQQNTGGNLVYSFDFPNSGGNGNIEGFTLDPSTGALSAIAGISATGSNGEFNPNGKYLFVVAASNGVASALDAFDVSASSALTTPLASVGWAPGAWQAFDTQ